MKQVLISSCEPEGGIFCYDLQSNGTLRLLQKLSADQPMYAIFAENRLCALERQPDSQKTTSTLRIWRWQRGAFIETGTRLSTGGAVAPHLCMLDGVIYAVNYLSGSIIKFPDRMVFHYGKGADPIRQSEPHPHSITPAPDGHLVVADLGTDKIYIYDKNLQLKDAMETNPGSGPRHIVFSTNGSRMFCVNELSSTVAMYSYESGQIRWMDEISMHTQKGSVKNLAAAIKFYRGKVYASNRGYDSIACVCVEQDHLKMERWMDCHGRGPRDFAILDSRVICANENSNTVTVLDLYTGRLLSVCNLPKPVCVTIVDLSVK